MPNSYRIILLPEAVGDLIRLREFIHEHNPNAANKAAKTIREAINKISKHPLIGKQVTDIAIENLRDLFVPFGQVGYLIRYLVTKNEIQIIKIWSGRENRNAQ